MGNTVWTGTQLGYALAGCRLAGGNLLLDWSQFAASGLVLYHANEGTGKPVADSSGNDNNAALTTGNWNVDPWMGASAMGASDTLTPASIPALGTSDWTMEMWVYVASNPNNSATFTYSPVFGPSSQQASLSVRYITNLLRWQWYVRDNATHNTGVQSYTYQGGVGGWTHVALVKDGNTARMYINGVQCLSFDITGWTWSAWNARTWATDAYLTGLDELRDSASCLYPNGTTFSPVRYPASGTGTADPALAQASCKPGLLTVTLSEALPTGTSVKAKLLSTTGGDTGFQVLTGAGTSYTYDFTGQAVGNWYPAVQSFAGGALNINTPTVTQAGLDWTAVAAGRFALMSGGSMRPGGIWTAGGLK